MGQLDSVKVCDNVALTNKYLYEINSILDKELFELVLVNKVNNLLVSIYKFNELVFSLLELLEKTVNFNFACLLLAESEKVDMFMQTPLDPKREQVQDIKNRTISSLPRTIQDSIEWDKLTIDFLPRDKAGGINREALQLGSFLAVPIKVRVGFYLVLAVGHTSPNSFSPEIENILGIIARQAAIVIDNAKLYRQVQEERNIVDAIVQSAAEGILVTNSKDRIISLNLAAKRIFGIKEGMSELPQGIRDFVFNPLLKEFSLHQGNIMTKEIDLTAPLKMTLRIEMTPLRDITGEKFGVVTLMHDITKRKEIDRMKTEFISTVSHELRTPLTTMKEFVSIILDGIAGNVTEEQKNYLNIIKNNINRLTRIINNLLDISKIEAGRVELKKERINIAKIINQEIPNFKTQTEAKGINLKIEIPETMGDVFVDVDKIIQVYTNLMGNAVKFTPPGGTIRINVEEKDGVIVSTVEDSGVGIAKEHLERIFDKFTQVDREPGSGERGTGLGLTISRGIIQMHKGKIWCESELGAGSKFIFTLPFYSEELGYLEQLSAQIRYAHESQKGLYLLTFGYRDADKIAAKSNKSLRQLYNETEACIREVVQGKASHMFHFTTQDKQELCVIAAIDFDERALFNLKEGIRNSLRDFKEYSLELYDFTIRFSQASYPQDGMTPEELIEKARLSLTDFV